MSIGDILPSSLWAWQQMEHNKSSLLSAASNQCQLFCSHRRRGTIPIFPPCPRWPLAVIPTRARTRMESELIPEMTVNFVGHPRKICWTTKGVGNQKVTLLVIGNFIFNLQLRSQCAWILNKFKEGLFDVPLYWPLGYSAATLFLM